MKTIRWNLPFKDMNYLLSLTEELAPNPLIILITGIQDAQGNIDSCSITLRETENVEEVILYIGATIGAHSVAYAMETQLPIDEEEQQEEEDSIIYLPEVAGTFADEEEAMKAIEENIQDDIETHNENADLEEPTEDLFEKATTEEPVNESGFRKFLRNILENFKK